MSEKLSKSVLTKDQFVEMLLDKTVTKSEDLAVFQALYAFEGYKAYASQIARILGKTGKTPHSSINLQIGRLAKRLAERHEINFSVRSNQTYRYWNVFFNGWAEGRFWIWQLREELVEALKETESTGELHSSEEILDNNLTKLIEGAKKTVTVNAYERNPQARNICIKHHGANCVICNFNFEKMYGDVGKGFIHVHHLTPIASIGQSYELDPVEDLRPVCPNCHSMLHAKNPPFSIVEMRQIIESET